MQVRSSGPGPIKRISCACAERLVVINSQVGSQMAAATRATRFSHSLETRLALACRDRPSRVEVRQVFPIIARSMTRGVRAHKSARSLVVHGPFDDKLSHGSLLPRLLERPRPPTGLRAPCGRGGADSRAMAESATRVVKDKSNRYSVKHPMVMTGARQGQRFAFVRGAVRHARLGLRHG